MSNLTIKENEFGLLANGDKVKLFTVSNGNMSVSVSDFGPTLTSIMLPTSSGAPVDVLLGFSTLEGFVQDDCSFGTGIGRYANRIGNASFELDGKKFKLDENDANRTLHGGFDRWEKKVWLAEQVDTKFGKGISFSRLSPDGEQGFPGNLKVRQVITLDGDNNLTLEYFATTDAPTVINLTNHAYFNLKGYNGGTVYDQELVLNCDSVLETEKTNPLPTGKKTPVAGTPFDFTKPKLIGKDIDQVPPGYDHCYCVTGYKADGSLYDLGYVKDPASGRKMGVKTDQPGVQLYTGNYIEGKKGKNGFVYHKHGALCLETQDFPNAPNEPSFPSTVLRPGEEYHRVTQYCFSF